MGYITACPNCGKQELQVVCDVRITYSILDNPDGDGQRWAVAHEPEKGQHGNPLYVTCANCGKHWGGVDADTRGIYNLQEYADGSYADYQNSVEAIARECIDNAREDNPDAGIDDVQELIWEAVDGSSWVVYTNQARKVEEHSDNWPDIDELGDVIDLSEPDVSFGSLYTAAALEAMNRDVYEKVEELLDAEEDADEDADA